MALSKATATQIVKTVKSDANCVKNISSVLAYFLPDDLGWTGGVRNFLMVFADIPNYVIEDTVNAYRRSTATKGNKAERFVAAKNFPSNSPRVDKIICTGIAEATAAALNRALKTSKELSSQIASVRMESRATGIAHAGTLIEMLDGSSYVFDWHMTLAPENPCIFKAQNWHNRIGGVTFIKFARFD
ncbi:MAG: hypothetical protein E2O58_04935 [Gammaproteobacteria bacterium]|nr:MAG: hypothetical protein E2O58_04935 [Gammaproteobacteria bacterium]